MLPVVLIISVLCLLAVVVLVEDVLLVFVATSRGFLGCVSVILVIVVWGGTCTVALYCVCPV